MKKKIQKLMMQNSGMRVMSHAEVRKDVIKLF